MTSLASRLSERARRQIVESQLEPQDVIDAVIDYSVEHERISHNQVDEAMLRSEIRDRLAGYGPLQPLLDDPTIEEIWINSTTEVFVAKSGISQKLPISIPQELLATLVEKMLRATGRRVDRSSPFVDASLQDGSRLHVVIPDITRNSWSINIRKFPRNVYSLSDLVEFKSISPSQAGFLSEALNAGKNILVSGATQAGKTTVLCALLNELAKEHRIVTVEETFEIRIDNADWVAMQTRQPNLEGVGEISLRRLVKEALRMRPGRIVVGEVREAESFDLLIALNSGLPGLCTIHANSATDAVNKLCTLPLLAGTNISAEFVNPTVGSCIDYVVHCQMLASGSRRVQEIAKVGWDPVKACLSVTQVKL
jgi:pilus assembly protein CpaF